MKNKVKLCVATPMYAGQCFGAFMVSVMRLQTVAVGKGWEFQFIFNGNESLITRGRNKLVEHFLQLDSTHLLFLDADMEFDPNSIASLVEYNVDVICGLCPKKYINWESVKVLIKNNPEINPWVIPRLISLQDNNVNYFNNQQNQQIPGLVPVKHAGTGCMLIKRDVFTRMSKSLPTFVDYGSDGMQPPTNKPLFFDTKVEEGSGAYLSEDYYFCDEWRKIGGTVYMAPHVKLGHIGIHTYY